MPTTALNISATVTNIIAAATHRSSGMMSDEINIAPLVVGSGATPSVTCNTLLQLRRPVPELEATVRGGICQAQTPGQ